MFLTQNTMDTIAGNEGSANEGPETERQTHAGGGDLAEEQTVDLLAGRQRKGEGGLGDIGTEGSQTGVSVCGDDTGWRPLPPPPPSLCF